MLQLTQNTDSKHTGLLLHVNFLRSNLCVNNVMIRLKIHDYSDIRIIRTYLPTMRIEPQISQNVPTSLLADIISVQPLSV